jgi:hypothetical protein
MYGIESCDGAGDPASVPLGSYSPTDVLMIGFDGGKALNEKPAGESNSDDSAGE